MQWQSHFEQALAYGQFLDKHGTPEHRQRWQSVYDQLTLTPTQQTLLHEFSRRMNVLCVAGAWCGDCVNQCPILQRFAQANDRIVLRFLDRDAHPDVQAELTINGGNRVPVVVFLSEDFQECARYGERTLSRYRDLAEVLLGPACPTGIIPASSDSLKSMTQEWLNEFERVQLMLRLSPRLRKKYGD